MSDWRFSHYAPSHRTDACEIPALMVNVVTGENYWSDCGSAKASRCSHCAEVKRGDVASIARSGWADCPTDRGVWLTLTAPGADVLPWDRSKCTHSDGVPCSGKIGCVCEAVPLAEWHSKMGARWTHFMTELRRSLNAEGVPPCDVQFVKTYEPQARGALHVHAMMRVTGVCSAKRFDAAVKKAARLNGFGDQLTVEHVDLSNERTAARVAGYLSKYSTKCADALGQVEVINFYTGEFRPAKLRSWSASWSWGDRMYETIARRRLWWLGAGAQAQRAPDPLDLYQDLYALDDYLDTVCGVPEPSALL